MRLFLPADAPPWLKAFANSVDDKLRNLLTAPLRLLGLATADLPDAAVYRQGLVYDLTTGQIAYSTGAAWNQLFGSGNAALNAVSSLTPAADKYVYFTSPTAAALGTITAFARTILDDADGGTVRATLGLGTMATAAAADYAALAGATFTGAVVLPAGSAATPSLRLADTNSGFYGGDNVLGFAVAATEIFNFTLNTFLFRPGGTTRLTVNTTGVNVAGVLTCSGNATLGDAAGDAHTVNGTLNLASGDLSRSGVAVVGTRKTGWGADTGTDKRTANATYSGTAEATYTQATIQALMDAVRDQSQTMKALKADLTTHGLIGT